MNLKDIKTPINLNLDTKGCFNLVGGVITHCTRQPKQTITRSRYHKTHPNRWKMKVLRSKITKCKNRRHFINNSKMIEMWCDCSDNFETNKLRKKVTKLNKEFMLDFKLALAKIKSD